MKNYKHKWIETLIVEDQHHLLREKDEQSYISYQCERLFLFIKHLIKGKPELPKEVKWLDQFTLLYALD